MQIDPPPPIPAPVPDSKRKSTEKTTAPIVVEEEQLLHMNNERFTVPEVVFNPSTIGSSFPLLPPSSFLPLESLPCENVRRDTE